MTYAVPTYFLIYRGSGGGKEFTIYDHNTRIVVVQEYRLSERTYSLWGHLTNTADEFVNPLYDHSRFHSYNPYSLQFIPAYCTVMYTFLPGY